jgi:hypothetical protein
MFRRLEVQNMFKKVWKNRKGTAEIVGTVLFLVILLFFFGNVFLWNNQVTSEINQVVWRKTNSPMKIETGDGGPLTLEVTNLGGVDVALSRLWLINSTDTGSETDHIYADLEPLNVWVTAGNTRQITLNTITIFNDDGSINATLNGETITVHYAPPSGLTVTFRILTKLGNTAAVNIDFSLPNIIILQPENKTYDTSYVPLTFTVNKTVSWMAYSLDGQTNVTIAGNTTLSVPDGTHYVVVYVKDNVGNVVASDRVYFTVDSEAPLILLVSPTNTAYASTSVPLEFVVYEPAFWIGYSLDDQMNVTVEGNITLADLSEGEHTITVYANDTAGHMGSSETVNFTVDSVPPTIQLLSPENKTYDSTTIPLTFTVSETTSWIGYSLDNQANVTIAGNTILIGLSEGPHTITVYANDTAGNTGYSTIYFTIDTTPPTITILSPENKIYGTTYVQLSFTVDEEVSWMAYSLDGQARVTITENVTLTIPDGLHYVVVYANDTAGNMIASNPVYFTVDSVPPTIQLLSPENKTYDSTTIPLTFTVSETTSWIGYSLDNQANVTIAGNTILIGLSDGPHTITVYASDTAGNTGYSDTIYFTIDIP